jgi:hypothetical protein
MGQLPGVDLALDKHEPHRPKPGSWLGKLVRDNKKPNNVMAAAESQMITPTARTHGVDPNEFTIRPATATANPTRRQLWMVGRLNNGVRSPAPRIAQSFRQSQSVLGLDRLSFWAFPL